MNFNQFIKKSIYPLFILMIKVKILEKTNLPILVCQQRIIMSLWEPDCVIESKYCLVMRKKYLTIHKMYPVISLNHYQAKNTYSCVYSTNNVSKKVMGIILKCPTFYI